MAPIAAAITRVLVTGFGPFGGVSNNPSFGVASRLPPSLPNDIELFVYPEAVPVAYHPVIDLMQKLIEEHQPDLVLSMGVAAGRSYFAVEQTSEKDRFDVAPDINDRVFTDEESDAIWGDQPVKLSTALDLHSVVEDWQNRTSDISWPQAVSASNFRQAETSVDVALREDVMDVDDVRWSDSVGNYLCGFIYYTDMVEMSRKSANKERDVAFMHVPMLDTEEELQMGTEIAVELLQALVTDWKKKASK